MVIDYLLTWMKKPFGLLDDDCFVFDPSCFKKIINFPEKTIVASFYNYANSKLGLSFPETFFLFLNTPVITKIKKQYKINSSPVSWNRLTLMARNKLLSIGISKQSLPENWKPYFDTLKAIMAIGLAEDHQFYYPDGNHWFRSDIMYHVGAVASVPLRGIRLHNSYSARGSYFWYRALESIDDREIQDRYYKRYGYIKPSDLLQQVPDSFKDKFERNDFFSAIERIINTNQPF
jgi:hypothetical protein